MNGEQIKGTIKAYEDFINNVAVSADMKWIISVSFDKTVGLCDANNFQFVKSFRGHISDTWGVDVSPDSRFAVTGSLDKDIWMWDLIHHDGSVELEQKINRVFVIGDGKRIISVTECDVQVWDIEFKICLDQVSNEGSGCPSRKEATEIEDSEEDKLFCEIYHPFIKLGTETEHVTLATLDVKVCTWTFSAKHQVVSVIPRGQKITCFKLENVEYDVCAERDRIIIKSC